MNETETLILNQLADVVTQQNALLKEHINRELTIYEMFNLRLAIIENKLKEGDNGGINN